jgi:hypothetical protein
MWDPIFDAVPGTRRMRHEVDNRRHRVEMQAARDPHDLAAQGALAAARWTLGEVTESPLSQDRAADRTGFEAELDLARSIFLSRTPGDRERAAGVREWLEWWV